MAGASDSVFRMTRLLTLFVLVARLVLRRATVVRLFVLLLLARFALAGLAIRREVLGFLPVARRTVRMARFAVFPKRGFFVFIPDCDPFSRCRILSDAP